MTGRDEASSAPAPSSAPELQKVIFEERKGEPFLQLRDENGEFQILPLAERASLTVGRNDDCDLSVRWDPEVSRLHAELELTSGAWVISDNGLSRNGTFVNGKRVGSRKRLENADVIQIGDTSLMYRNPKDGDSDSTKPRTALHADVPLSEQQQKVLAALAAPILASPPRATPASNREISETLHLSVDTVKGHLRTLFQLFEVSDLPQNEKRGALVAHAIAAGKVSVGD